MMRSLYAVAASLALPAVAAGVSAVPRYRPLRGRLNPEVPDLHGKPVVWIHACSVGEVRAASPLISALREHRPDVSLVLTVSTVNGRALADQLAPDAFVTWLPFDHPYLVRRFVRALRPAVLGLIETELWPALIWETTDYGAPVVLLNGRLSDRHYARNRRHAGLMRPIVSRLAAACMQNRVCADRIVSLGLPPDRVTIGGNTKFASASAERDPQTLARLRHECDLNASDLVIVFGSTRPGDEALIAACWEELHTRYPRLKFVIAPRHPERANSIPPLFSPEGMARRSDRQSGRAPAAQRLFLLDTVGELGDFYGLAAVAVVGGSFAGGIGGHNPIEPAALGVPTVFGQDMRNFSDPAAMLLEAGGAIQTTPERLSATLGTLLADPEARHRVAERGRAVVAENQGAVRTNVETIVRALERNARAA